MSEPKVGFEIQGKFYPWVILDTWKTKEARIARYVAGANLHELLTGKSDNAAINMAFAAVAWWRGNPVADEGTVQAVSDEWSADDVKLIGFDQPDLEGDASPPDKPASEAPGPKPSEAGEPTSAPTSEKSTQKTSGSPPSEPSTESGLPQASEN